MTAAATRVPLDMASQRTAGQVEVGPVDAGGIVKCLHVPDADELSRSEIDRLEAFVKKELGGKGLAWIRIKADGEWQSPIVKFLSEDERAQIRHHVDLPVGLPLVLVDEARIKQAILNLLVNARQAMAIALASYQKIRQDEAARAQQAAEKPDQNSDDVRKSGDAALAAWSAKIVSLAEYAIEKWPDTDEAASAIAVLAAMAVERQEIGAALKLIEKLKPGSARRADTELRVGRAIWAQYVRAKKDLDDQARFAPRIAVQHERRLVVDPQVRGAAARRAPDRDVGRLTHSRGRAARARRRSSRA